MATARFRLNVKQLMLKKSVETGERITQKQVADAVGLSPTAMSRWMTGSIERLDADSVFALMDYFDCDYTDIVTGIEKVK